MFSKLLKSSARKSLLEIFLNDSRQKYYLRELAVMIHYSPGSLQRELNSLVEDELLLAEKMGNLRFFSLNTKSPYVKDLRHYLQSHPQNKAELASKKPTAPNTLVEASKIPKVAKRQSKPVLERREAPSEPIPAPVAPTVPIQAPAPAPALAPAAPSAPTPPPPVFNPAKAPIHENDAYTPRVSPFSKPILSKPHLEKPNLETVNPKPNSSFDYPIVQPSPGFEYIQPQTEVMEEPAYLSYTPETPIIPPVAEPAPPTIQPATHQNPPDESDDDIRLHIA